MRSLTALLSVLALMGALQPAFAESGPLAPGKAAGVQAAQENVRVDKLALFGALGLALVGAYLAVGTNYNNYPKKGGHSNRAAASTH